MLNASRSDCDALIAQALDEGGIAVAGLRPGAIDTAERFVTREERLTAERIVHTPRQRAYLTCRAFVRIVMARRLRCAPGDVSIVVGATGHPVAGDGAFAFSTSHARGLSVVALSARRRVGIDIERRDRRVDVPALTGRFFQQDWADPAAEDAPTAAERYLRAWTRHEAIVKATGQGLVFPADAVVPAAGGLRVDYVSVDPAYVVAMAADGPACKARVALFPPLPPGFGTEE